MLKYSPLGNLDWARRFDGSAAGVDEAAAIARGRNGGVVVTGITTGVTQDFVTCAFSATGDTLWRWFFGGRGRGEDRSMAIATVSDGYVVTGSSAGSGTGLDIVTSKLDSTGTVLSVISPASVPRAFGFEIDSPNPTQGSIAIDVAMPGEGRLSISVFDLQGREVGIAMPTARYMPGRHHMKLNLSSLHPGIYVIRASGTMGTLPLHATRKLSVVR